MIARTSSLTFSIVACSFASAFNRSNGSVLLGQRPAGKPWAGYWEFPGGKVEVGETVLQALQRELLEEVNLQVHNASAMLQLQYAYPEKTVLLDVWLVEDFSGEGEGLEGQQTAWVHQLELGNYQFPDANAPILTAVAALF